MWFRDALLDNALEAIAEHGVEGLSLREAAHKAGVSPSAAYRHFEDKAALLAEIARRTFADLAEAIEATMQDAVRGRRGAASRASVAFRAHGDAHVRFAHAVGDAEPGHVRSVGGGLRPRRRRALDHGRHALRAAP